MHDRKWRVSAVTVLVGVVMLLLPALAYMQYQWLGQLSEAERERMQRTLRTAASQFAIEFDNELSKALVGLQVDGAVARDENWTNYTQRYSAWAQTASEPKIISEVLLVDAPPGRIVADLIPPLPPPPPPPPAYAPEQSTGRRRGRPADARVDARSKPSPIFETALPTAMGRQVSPDQLRLRRWNAATMAFEPMAWTPELIVFRDSLATRFVGFQVERTRRNGNDGSFSFTAGDDNTLISPVTLFEVPPDRQGPPKITILGFTMLRLDLDVVKESLLTSLTARHFHADEAEMDYRVAVVARDEPSKLVWESEPGAATTIGNAPDAKQDFMSARPDQMFIFARNGDRNIPANAAVRTENIVVSMVDGHEQPRAGGTRIVMQGGGPRGGGSIGGRWTLLAKHRAGSLEAAVAGVRQRNLLLSTGILMLLTVSVGLIVVSTRRAQELARQQMEFVAAVSHELRTPVSVIGAAAGNLADGVVGDPQRVRKYGETIQGEARRLGETVERVLQLAGIAAGRAAAAVGPVCPAELVADSIAACRTEIENAGVEVETEVPMDLPMVVGDAAALRSALQNLISNAVKYGGTARWVRVRASADGASPAGHAHTVAQSRGWRNSGRTVTFTVEDHGIGISPEDRKHIFEPFYRGREAVSQQIKGSGLGLNLVMRIAAAHGGRVTATSEPGKGSSFTITLPAADNSALQAQSAKFNVAESH